MRTAFLAVLLAVSAAAQAADPPAGPKPELSFRLVLSDLEPTRDREEREARLLYASFGASYAKDGWGARAELRATEGKFLPYYPGSVWLEEGYVFLPTPVGEVRAGKLPSVVGLPDTTFGGSLLSANGVARNPDWGAGLAGERRFGWNSLGWTVRYVGQNDRVAWEDDGRGVESDQGATLRDGVDGRVSYLVNGGLWTVRPGVSAGTGRVVRSDGRPDFTRTDLSGDLTATFGPLSVSFLYLHRDGDAAAAAEGPRLAYDSAAAGLVSVSLELPTVVFRYVYTEWHYRSLDGNERIHQPAAVWMPKQWRFLEATVEYAARRLRLGAEVRTFNAFQLGLAARF